jgi:hypothetical protein
MSENNIEYTEVEVMSENEEVTIKIPINYYIRVNQLIYHYFPFRDEEHMQETIKKVSEETDDTPETYHLRTLLSLQLLIEDQARVENKIKKIKVNKETGEPINED